MKVDGYLVLGGKDHLDLGCERRKNSDNKKTIIKKMMIVNLEEERSVESIS